MGLDSFLIMPMQRLCRYPMFLEELLSMTLVTHSDHPNLVNALNSIKEHVEEANNRAKNIESYAKLEEIEKELESRTGQPLNIASKRCIYREFIDKIEIPIALGRKKAKLKTMYLFTDMIITTYNNGKICVVNEEQILDYSGDKKLKILDIRAVQQDTQIHLNLKGIDTDLHYFLQFKDKEMLMRIWLNYFNDITSTIDGLVDSRKILISEIDLKSPGKKKKYKNRSMRWKRQSAPASPRTLSGLSYNSTNNLGIFNMESKSSGSISGRRSKKRGSLKFRSSQFFSESTDFDLLEKENIELKRKVATISEERDQLKEQLDSALNRIAALTGTEE
eukprot:TRINITY_DN2338_c0_g1_i2.p1 TRINITY_DN2338_c0_g1~~TRINITY_DN2338_c0_g1_i2.p1  ORF type:complete len:334 (+),score=72.24 TRINITY_DN2338_c0_g1_i2:812-1813(+)